MKLRGFYRTRTALGVAAAATLVAALGAVTTTTAHAGTAAAPAAPGVLAAGWTGTFNSFPSASWKSSWGYLSSGTFGLDRVVNDAGGGKVTFGRGSSAPSCTNCPTAGGAQFFTNLNSVGRSDYANGNVLSLRYELKFPAGHDFGKGGKLPGLYGGPPNQSSGGTHGNAWSTRFMFRNGNKGEVYFYSPDGGGYGKDLGLGRWTYPTDNQYHSIEQVVNRSAQTVTVYFDNRQVFSGSVPGVRNITFGGIFFSTFYGGHSTEWGPSKTSYIWFRSFSLSNAKQ
jgi:hypothetical protein